MVLDELIEQAASRAAGRRIQDVRAGLGYTCVVLEGGACGLAYSFRNQMGCVCTVLGEAGKLIGRTAEELLAWAKGPDLLRSAIGIATINAVLNDSETDWDTGNVMEAFHLGPDDTFGMVGDFKPILNKVRQQTEHLYVFELNPAEGSGFYPSETIPLHLPKCDVVVLTATSLINHTFDDVIAHCKNVKQVLLVGPSTTLCPDVFRRYGVDLLAGTVVTDTELMLKIISQGGGTMAMKPAVRQVLVRTNKE